MPFHHPRVDRDFVEHSVRDAVALLTGRLTQEVGPADRLVEDYLLDPLGIGALAEEINAAFIRKGVPLGVEFDRQTLAPAITVADVFDLVLDRVSD